MIQGELSRRSWIQLALLHFAGSGISVIAAESVQFDKDPFQMGVASGSPTHESVVIWTRLMPFNPMRNPWGDQTLRVEWEVAKDVDFNQVVKRGAAMASPELSHSIHVEVQGLAENQIYWYRFHAYGITSPIGRTRTFPSPAADVGALKVAFACCQRYHSGAFNAYDQMEQDKPDVVVFLGDYIYESGATSNEVRGRWEYPAHKYEQYRNLYELAHSDQSLTRMRAQCPWLVIWDDHEVLNDYAGGEARRNDISGKVSRQMLAGYKAWYEHMPVSPRVLTGGVRGLVSESSELRIYGSYRWGNLASFHLLDTRQYRSTPTDCGIAGLFDQDACPDLRTSARTILGDEQERWLQEEFSKLRSESAHHSCIWNLLCQSMVFTPFCVPVMGSRYNHDNWDGYPLARNRVIKMLESEGVRNPVIIGGDVHQNWVAHVHADPMDVGSKIVAPEFTTTSITTRSIGSFTAADMMRLAPHCIYTDRHRRGYTVMEITPEHLSVELKASAPYSMGTTSFPTIAKFMVENGSPNIKQLQ